MHTSDKLLDIWTRVVSFTKWRIICDNFDFMVKQFFILYISHDWTSDYQDLLSIRTEGLTKKRD